VTALRGKIDLASLKVNFDSVEVRELMNKIKSARAPISIVIFRNIGPDGSR
jgi:hypothetical protein